jgi:hypothetical protein
VSRNLTYPVVGTAGILCKIFDITTPFVLKCKLGPSYPVVVVVSPCSDFMHPLHSD